MDWIDVTIIAAKVLIVFGFLLTTVLLTIWAERKVVALMQQRIGPNRVGPFGILQSLADGVKLFFKEDVRPAGADPSIYPIAPLFALIPAFLAFAVVPFGDVWEIGGRTITFQLADLNIGILFFTAMGSLMVYGVTLAGWSSGSAYPLLGGIRASAQMISYEIAMGMAVAAVVLGAGTLSTSGIVDAQAGTWLWVIPRWHVFTHLPAFVIFIIAGFAETNRAPFDLPEAETELVAGFHTEYSGLKFAMFFLAEYVHIVATSAIAVTLFLGGWRGPIFPVLEPLWPVVWFLAKVGALVFVFMWARATMPRIRYDALMRFGWKVMLPVSFAWVMIAAVLVVVEQEVSQDAFRIWTGVAVGLLVLAVLARLTVRRLPEIRASVKGGAGGVR